MIYTTFFILLPLFVSILGGFLISSTFKIDEHTLTRILTDFFMPALVFSSLYNSKIVFSETVNLLGAVSFAFVILLILSVIYCKITDVPVKEFIFPVCFMNSGFLGFPLMIVWGGAAALNIEVVIDQMQTFILFTIGIIILKGGFSFLGLIEILKTPLLWAIVAGFAFKFSGLVIPEKVIEIFSFCGSATTALAAFTVGCSIKLNNLYIDKHILTGLFLRFAGGFLAGWLASLVFNLTGNTRTIMIVATSLPSALSAYILPLRYNISTRISANIVISSTILGIFLIPVVFTLAELL